ncbi:ATP-binding protein [Streptomyces polygonati]|uniref:ATP-binding protein n=1 Tax=Streptomyces polygonati TaxID=1617087 RepID=A0ABV8HWQ2_9ACTN
MRELGGHDRLALAATTSAVGRARAFADLAGAKWEDPKLVEDLLVVVSELVTNAVKALDAVSHDAGGIGALVAVELVRLDDCVLVEVSDTAPGLPALSDAEDPDAEGGRGLLMVEVLAAGWGWRAVPGGKVVWARLART